MGPCCPSKGIARTRLPSDVERIGEEVEGFPGPVKRQDTKVIFGIEKVRFSFTTGPSRNVSLTHDSR